MNYFHTDREKYVFDVVDFNCLHIDSHYKRKIQTNYECWSIGIGLIKQLKRIV